jgi:hypothetical protein
MYFVYVLLWKAALSPIQTVHNLQVDNSEWKKTVSNHPDELTDNESTSSDVAKCDST